MHSDDTPAQNGRLSLSLGVLVGWPVMGFGVWGLIHESSRTHPDQWLRWFAGILLAHDLLVAPAVFALGVLLGARVPRGVCLGLAASAMIVATSWPVLAGYGRTPDNPSVLPNHYAAGLLTVLGAVWLTVAGPLVAAHLRRVGERRR
jgi:hypothetical protein